MTVYLKPAAGVSLPMEDGRPWPADGENVELTTYVRRRLNDGDLVKANPPKPEKPAVQAPAAKAPAVQAPAAKDE